MVALGSDNNSHLCLYVYPGSSFKVCIPFLYQLWHFYQNKESLFWIDYHGTCREKWTYSFINLLKSDMLKS
jgi:hypothetical protein